MSAASSTGERRHFSKDYDVSWEQTRGIFFLFQKTRTYTATGATIAIRASATAFATVGRRAPCPFLAECVAGIEIAEPGCKKIRISPKMCGLDFIKVSYPTPLGILKAEIRRSGNGFSTEYSAPEGMTVEIV